MKLTHPKMLIVSALIVAGGAIGLQESLVRSSKSSDEKNTIIHYQPLKVKELPKFAEKGIDWLASVQFEDGSWGAGSHSAQHLRDARQVQADPGTTAFASLALLRAGNTLESGQYSKNLNKSLQYLLNLVEECPENSERITSISGTQPQVKLGQNIDASLCVKFFTRVLPFTKHDKTLENRVNRAIDKCLSKIQKSQNSDGSVRGGGWAPVLQDAMVTEALETGYNLGRDVDKKALERAKDNQKQNVSKNGEVKSDKGAGVSLYSVASNQRATAQESRKAQDLIEKAKKEGKLPANAPVNTDNLLKIDGLNREEAEKLADAYTQNEITVRKMQDDEVLRGFGNNGGEEFLSFMMTSESLVITGGDAWTKWQGQMHNMLSSIQNQDGSWNGHHCITSPVFCTAAVILSLTAENDRELLMKEKK
jgi:hypothetical protein